MNPFGWRKNTEEVQGTKLPTFRNVGVISELSLNFKLKFKLQTILTLIHLLGDTSVAYHSFGLSDLVRKEKNWDSRAPPLAFGCSLDKAERLIADAAAYGSQLVVFPEAFVGGYPREMLFDAMSETQSTDGNNEIQKYHASAIDVPGPEVDRLAEIAGKYKVHLVIGVVERGRSSLFSAVLFFDSLGRYLGQHRKLMLMASECTVWCAGAKSSPPVYESMVGRIGGLICWDNRMPLLRTELHTNVLLNDSSKLTESPM
ncbi:hypothetical protein ACSBR2_002604 [Camellia fascicularis]